jgi:hypothetical protein
VQSENSTKCSIILGNLCPQSFDHCECLLLHDSYVTDAVRLFCSFTGVLILLALGLLTPYFYFIPKASLAAVIICAVIFMIEYEVVKPMWKSSRKLESRVIARTHCSVTHSLYSVTGVSAIFISLLFVQL